MLLQSSLRGADGLGRCDATGSTEGSTTLPRAAQKHCASKAPFSARGLKQEVSDAAAIIIAVSDKKDLVRGWVAQVRWRHI